MRLESTLLVPLLIGLAALSACGDKGEDDANGIPDGDGDSADAGTDSSSGGGNAGGGSANGSPQIPVIRGAVQARTAEAFVESVGIATHLGYTDEIYWDFAELKKALIESKVRYIRDGFPGADYQSPGTKDAALLERHQSLAEHGIRGTLIGKYPSDPTEAGARVAEFLAVAHAMPGAVVAFEHANEPDLFDAPNDGDWQAHLAAFMRALAPAWRADPILGGKPILTPSVVGWGEVEDFAASFPECANFADYSNNHPYPAGDIPESTPLRAAGDWSAHVGRIPVQATETGYHTAVNQTGGQSGVSEAAQAIYLPRLFLEYFALGYARTHAYEFLDEWPDPELDEQEKNFGIVRNDWSRKPAFHAIRRLLTLLEDPGPAFEPGALRLWLSDRDVHQVTLSKRDGSFWVALWRAKSVYDTSAKVDIDVSPTSLRITLGEAPKSVTLHDPTGGAEPTAISLDGNAFDVPVGASVALLEIKGLPAIAAAPATVDLFDDLAVANEATAMEISHEPLRMYDYDAGLASSTGEGTLTYQVDGLHDFRLRVYRFCEGCFSEPLENVSFSASPDGVTFTSLESQIIDHRPTMDARQIAYFVPREPLPEGTTYLRIAVGQSGPVLSELVLRD